MCWADMEMDAMRNARVAWAVGMSLAFGSPCSFAQERFPTMASLQGRMPCGSCTLPSTISSQATIAPPSEAGERLVISGTVYEPDGVTPASRDHHLRVSHGCQRSLQLA